MSNAQAKVKPDNENPHESENHSIEVIQFIQASNLFPPAVGIPRHAMLGTQS